MGEYWKPVNLTRLEYINPHDFGCGLKISEWAWEGSPVLNEIAKRWRTDDVVVYVSDGGKVQGRTAGLSVPLYQSLGEEPRHGGHGGFRRVGPNTALEHAAYDIKIAREAQLHKLATDPMTSLEQAIYAAAYVDAFREMFTDHAQAERVRLSRKEAEFVVACFRVHGNTG